MDVNVQDVKPLFEPAGLQPPAPAQPHPLVQTAVTAGTGAAIGMLGGTFARSSGAQLPLKSFALLGAIGVVAAGGQDEDSFVRRYVAPAVAAGVVGAALYAMGGGVRAGFPVASGAMLGATTGVMASIGADWLTSV